MRARRQLALCFLAGLSLAGCVIQWPVNLPSVSEGRPETESVQALMTESPAPAKIKEEIEVPIIIYHHIKDDYNSNSEADKNYTVTVANFRAQLDYLVERGFAPILISDIARYFAGDFKWPDKPIVITFDDGLISQYQSAWPILRERGFKATFFIFTNPIGKNDNYFNWEQINELAEAGSEIGSHGHYHLFWDKITDQELRQEIIASKEMIEAKIGRPVIAAAYPFGQSSDQATQALKDAGYLVARDIVNGRSHQSAELFKLKAYFVTNDFSRFKTIVGD
ncbi:MAG TPA: polysaccharide deacetylase family protein [bacterium]|nr:polysaccharide deacetylase family protein [bacterium]